MQSDRISRFRRRLLHGGVIGGGAWLAGLGLPPLFRDARAQEPGGQPTSADSEPSVWRDFTQQELDAAYAQNVWAPNMGEVLARYGSNSERTRARLGAPQRYRYGETSAEMLDVYRADTAAAPIQVFVHGGGWAAGSASEHAFLAETFVDAGAHFIALDFASVRNTGGDLLPLVANVRRAIHWIYRNAGEFGGDASRLFVSGHSSGGHLAGVLLTTDWPALFDLPTDVIKGGLCCSGMFDLEPVSLSSRSDNVSFDARIVEALSPQRHIEHLAAPLVIGYGSLESPEFQRQSRDFADAIRMAGKPVRLLLAEHYNHFEILETLANPYGLLGRAALEQMQLA
jgi:arylformamidase